MHASTPDLLLIGGGLANCLIAWRLAEVDPACRITIAEAGPGLGGNHTWSFHAGDVSEPQHAWLAPFVVHRWAEHEVRFPEFRRRLDSGYLSMTSDALHRVMVATGRFELKPDCRVQKLTPTGARTDAGETLEARAVIDGRGPGRSTGMVLGFQKFIGRQVRLAAPHQLAGPIIMDATVSQDDGYRFVYVLPLADDTVLIEDTRYSDGDSLDPEEINAAIDVYAKAQGWTVVETVREEHGVLPILLAGDFERFWPAEDPVARAGLAAGLFQPTTGYSLPQAVALADHIAERWTRNGPLDGPALARITRDFSRDFWARTGFYRLLNRMLFRAGRPECRYRVLQRFYTLSEPLITNFYAGRLKLHQKARLLVGKPPVPVREALPLILENSFISREH